MKDRYKIIPAVHLFLQKNNKILLLRRINTGYADGHYCLVSGHVEKQESFKEAIIREAKEEINIFLNENDLEIVHIIDRKMDERIDIFIKTDKWTGEIKNLEKDKCDYFSWFEIDNLPSNIIPHVKEAIKCIDKKIFFSVFNYK